METGQSHFIYNSIEISTILQKCEHLLENY